MTNAAAIGYMILAARKMNLDIDIIHRFQIQMFHAMDERTEEEAEEAYREN